MVRHLMKSEGLNPTPDEIAGRVRGLAAAMVRSLLFTPLNAQLGTAHAPRMLRVPLWRKTSFPLPHGCTVTNPVCHPPSPLDPTPVHTTLPSTPCSLCLAVATSSRTVSSWRTWRGAPCVAPPVCSGRTLLGSTPRCPSWWRG
jgi:hypothetical protein